MIPFTIMASQYIKLLKRLQSDESQKFRQTLALIVDMLRWSPKERVYSWEAKLDMHEILHSDIPQKTIHNMHMKVIPPPRKGKLDNVSTPLHRASRRGNQARTKALIGRGWTPDTRGGENYSPFQLAECFGHQIPIDLSTGC